MAAKSKTGSRKVERAMHEMKRGRLKSGRVVEERFFGDALALPTLIRELFHEGL
jgi:hypothetical protein